MLAAYSLMRAAFGVLESTAPDLGARWAADLWFRLPFGSQRPAVPLAPGTPFTVRVDGRRVVGQSWGEGPPVYLVHGWGGWGTQLTAFVEPLVSLGFKVVTFDGPSHGESEAGLTGKGKTTLFEQADALAMVVAAHGSPYAVIAHSAGAAITTMQLREGLKPERLVYLAPMAHPVPSTVVFAKRLGFGERIRRRMVRRIEGRVGITMDAFDVPSLAQYQAVPPLLVVHDKNDSDTPFEGGQQIARAWPEARLVTTLGLGHNRILRDKAVVAEAVEFLRARP
jgi:pimeloyl-ACP methyl ester carboxylesterase